MYEIALTWSGVETTWLELFAATLALAAVAGNIYERTWSWWLTITSSLLYALLFYHVRLYGEAGLQVLFSGIGGWALWLWWRHDGRHEVPEIRPRRLGRERLSYVFMVVFATWPLLAWALASWTDTDVPWWDALPTVGSVAAQILLAQKYLENWLVWMGFDLIAIGLFAWKGLWLTSLIYTMFLGLAWSGYRRWSRLCPA